MEVKKSKKADLESEKSTGLLIGYIVALAAMFACFEYTTREYKETDVVYATVPYVSEEEIIPITQPIFQAAPPPPAEAPKVPEILEIVDNETELVEEEILPMLIDATDYKLKNFYEGKQLFKEGNDTDHEEELPLAFPP